MKLKRYLYSVILVLFMLNNLQADIIITSIKPSDCNISNGSATIKVTSGTKPYSFVLSGPTVVSGIITDESVTISNLPEGDYVVYITDSHGCSGSMEFTLGVTAMSLGIDSYVFPHCCDNMGVILLTANAADGTPPYVYSWPDGQYYTEQSGTYTVTATDANGCKKSKSISISGFTILTSKDPNSIKGPNGYGKSRFVSINDELQYTVHFENDPKLATAPAQRVTITMPVDKNLDPYSFSLGSYGFGRYTFDAPANRLFYQTRLDLTDSLGLFLYITTGIDVTKNLAYWIFESVDPNTGSNNTLNRLKGFLPVNDTTTHSGEGFISFKFKPKPTCQTADSVRMSAKIIFDNNDAMSTGITWNLIDARPPVSRIDSVYFDPFSSRYYLSFAGKDDTLGSGLKDYNLFVSENKGPFNFYQENVISHTFPFLGKNETNYDFYVAARDNVNNSGALDFKPEASIFCTNEPFLKVPTDSTSICTGMNLPISWKPVQGAFLDFEFSQDNGKSFSLIASEIDASKGSISWNIPHVVQGIKNGMIRVINSNSRVVIDTSEVFSVHQGIVTEAGINLTVCAGTEVKLGGTPTASSPDNNYIYNWSPQEALSSIAEANPNIIINTNKTFYVNVNNSMGCEGYDSVKIIVSSPELTINGLESIYCLNSESSKLSGIPSNGVFTGDGIQNGSFYPDKAGLGFHEISYSYKDANSCPHIYTTEIKVNNALEVSFTGLRDRYNVNDAPVALTGKPLGGTYSGSGIKGNTFDPSKAELGVYTITYTYTLPGGCTNMASKEVTVDNISSINSPQVEELCSDAFIIFPGNPVNEITINFKPCRPMEGMMALYDISGNRIEVIQNGLINFNFTQLNVSRLMPGVYFIVITSGNRSTYKKFVKM